MKFGNGIMICFGEKTVSSIKIGNTWGNIYSSGTFNPNITFPQTFKAIKSCNANYKYLSYSAFIGDLSYTTSGITGIELYRGTAAPASNYVITYQAFGTWK